MPPTRPSRKAKERHALVRPGRRQRATNISEDIEEQVTIVGNSPNQDTASASSALIALPPSPAIPGVSELAAEMLRQMKADGLIMRSANLMGPTVPVPATSTAPQTHTTPQATMSHSSTAREGLTSVERPEQVGVAISDVNSSTFATEAISSLTGPTISALSSQHGHRSDPNSGTTITNLSARVHQLIDAALSKGSKQLYRRAFTLYSQFVVDQLHVECCLPISVHYLALFIASLVDTGLASSTIHSYISAISYIHKLGGFSDPTQSFLIRKMLVGLHKGGNKPDFRQPITLDILHKIVTSLSKTCTSYYDMIMFKSMYLLAFHAFLRIGEIAYNGNAQNVLQLSNIQFYRLGDVFPFRLEICFKSYKGHYNCTPVTLTIKVQQNIEFCPVQALFQYLKLRGSSEGPIYIQPNRKAVTYQCFCNMLKQTLLVAQYDPTRYRSHSFRIGAASTAASRGISEADIQAMGRWHSNAFKRYIRIPTLQIE
ncbi:uncharacterized protein LOC117316694 [Pecten maximus]|uniref:uncharacterized protein LOC117316694 n=1 Tax=Pecten maximus TaxID=6579 RepID=UPI001458486A|nr:uncharacterized protein LOC117316694 [Pecten maximus]